MGEISVNETLGEWSNRSQSKNIVPSQNDVQRAIPPIAMLIPATTKTVPVR
jgi:hypothetical protein